MAWPLYRCISNANLERLCCENWSFSSEMAEQHPTFPVLFSAVVGDEVELTLCVQHAPETEASGLQTS